MDENRNITHEELSELLSERSKNPAREIAILEAGLANANAEVERLKGNISVFACQLQAWGFDAAAKELIDEVIDGPVKAPDYYELKAENTRLRASLYSERAAFEEQIEDAKMIDTYGAIKRDQQKIIDKYEAEVARLRERVAELEAEARWIPVSERLPYSEDGSTVLATNGKAVTEAKYYFYAGALCKNGWYQIDGMALGVGWATHWRPLPNPPEAE